MSNLLYFLYESNPFSLRYAVNFFPELFVLCPYIFFIFFDCFNQLVSDRETLSSVSTFTERLQTDNSPGIAGWLSWNLVTTRKVWVATGRLLLLMIIGNQEYNDRVTKVLLHAFSRFALKGHAITLTLQISTNWKQTLDADSGKEIKNTRIELVGKPYREVCLRSELRPWRAHQPNSWSKRPGTWIEQVLAYCRDEQKYVRCIELLFCLTVTTTFGVRTWKFIGLMDEILPIYQPIFTDIRS